MRKILSLIAFILISKFSFAQEKAKETKQIKLICGPSKYPPLLTLNDKYIVEVIDILKPDDINEVIVKKATDSLTKIYGEKAKNGIVEINLKDNIQLLNLNELYNQLHIQTKDRNLPLYVNDKKILHKEQFVAASSWVKEVEVINQSKDEYKENRYINLKTK